MKVTPPKGMHDILPEDLRLRDAMQRTILETYLPYGFERIETPILEDADNLVRSEGGENLSLIFQVMKRGDKLAEAQANGTPLWDMGLRYDLTLPLCRFYARHRNELLQPFKCIQIGEAYRAERPQRGRLRAFIQCDIDILGTDNPNAELELVAVTTRALTRLGLSGFTLRLNDRRVLQALLASFNVPEELHGQALIALDKLGKIGLEGVAAELLGRGVGERQVSELCIFLSKSSPLEALMERLSPLPALDALLTMGKACRALSSGDWDTVIDPTLVRGQGYYTGTLFEVTIPGFPGSIAGGGRYDRLVGSFTGNPTPAVGFSIGFEPIFAILKERGVKGEALPKLALLYDIEDAYPAVFQAIQPYLGRYVVSTLPISSNISRQKKKLRRDGYEAIPAHGAWRTGDFVMAGHLGITRMPLPLR